MSESSKVLAILCSDIHLSHNAPLVRSAEPDWYQAMDRQLSQLRELQRKNNCPVIIAGDIFDKWNSPAELINFAFDSLPARVYAIPGQHDLPNHRTDQLGRSAYGTLVKSGRITDIGKQLEIFTDYGSLVLHGFPWGSPVEANEDVYEDEIHVAVVHAYVYRGRAKYPTADPDNNVNTWKKRGRFDGYHIVHLGDNHKLWVDEKGRIFNPGSFFRRTQDEWNHKPVVGFLTADDQINVKLYHLGCSEDKFLTVPEEVERRWTFNEFIHDLSELDSNHFDFVGLLSRYINDNKISEGVRQVILEAIG